MKATIDTYGNITIATVEPSDDALLQGFAGTGIARCRPEDHFDQEIGERLAIARAIQDFGRAVEAAELLKPITEDEFQMQPVTLTLIDKRTGRKLDRTMPRLAASEVMDFAATVGVDLVSA